MMTEESEKGLLENPSRKKYRRKQK